MQQPPDARLTPGIAHDVCVRTGSAAVLDGSIAPLGREYVLGLSTIKSRELLDRELYYVADYNLDADRRVARELEHRTAPNAAVYVWGFEPAIYWFSGRLPASRFVYNVPQRVTWEQGFARRELLRDLNRRPPEAIIVQHNDVFNMVTGNGEDSHDALPEFPELFALVEDRYDKVTSVEDFDLYLRRPRGDVQSAHP